MDKGCSACHNGTNIGGGMYAPFGVVEKPGAELLPPADKGRFMVTKTPSDEYVFKVPTLRNITLTAPYFHTGQAWDLRQAVAVMGSSQLGAWLTDNEVDKITAFLGSLTGEQPKVTCRSCHRAAPARHVRSRDRSRGQPMNEWCTAFTAPAEATVTITNECGSLRGRTGSLTRHGILDADYEPAAKKDSQLEALLLPDGTSTLLAALRVVDSAEAPTASLSAPDDAFDAADTAANSSR